MISTLNIRSASHNSCEDSLYVVESESFIDGIISDGCSTGIKSHFASQAICYAFQKHGESDAYTDDSVIKKVKSTLVWLSSTLGLDQMNMLATIVLFHYNKLDKTLRVRVFGDGYYYVNDVEYIVDQNNTPDYLGYHLNIGFDTFQAWLDKYPEKVYENVDKFMICSDGITRIERSALQPDAKIDPNALLFHPPTTSNYLTRMWNLIKRDHWTLSDDLSIVSYVS